MLLVAMHLLTSPLLAAPASTPPPAGSPDVPAIHLLAPDTVATVGRPLTLRARLDDPGRTIIGVRFFVNGRAEPDIPRGPGNGRTEIDGVITPGRAGRVAILVEARDATGRVLARDILWLKVTSPYSESVQVQASPLWGDLIPKESLLHQHPVVSVHSFAAVPNRTDEDRFGANHRPVHVVFLVDGKGFGERLPRILETLGAIGVPAGSILRERDEIGQLVIGDAPEVRRDFRDGSLRKAVELLREMGGAGGGGAIDLGLLLRSIVTTSPPTASTIGVVVTNGVHWGTLWRRKTLPGTEDPNYLLTLDDIQQIRARAWEKDITFSTIAVSTPEFPLEMDEKGRMSFEPLERKVTESLSKDAGGSGSTAGAAATFNVYIHQMFDLLATLSAATGAERGVRLSRETPASLRESVADVLQPIVGRFQRRDFEVFEAPPGAKCPATGRSQVLEGVSARSHDKLLLAIAVDRSGSTHLVSAAHEVQTALRGILKSLRSEDCLLLYSFSALDAERVSNCIDSEEMVDLASGQIISGASRSQGTDIYGSAFTIANNMLALEVYAGGQGHPLDAGQEVDKAIIILTDGWQTRETMDLMGAVSFLRKHRIRVFEVLIEGDAADGKQIAGWSADTGGALLPPNGVPLPLGGTQFPISQLIDSVYWGMRDVYRLDYTSSSPEKEWRDVCVRIKDRPDLFVLREGGDGYRADKSAYAHLFRMIEDRQIPMASRRQALEAVGELGTEFEFRRVASVAEGAEAALRAPALVASLRMSNRLGSPAQRLEKIYANMDTPTRLAVVKGLEGSEGYEEAVVDRLLGSELGRPPGQTSEELRWETVVALGRLNEGLSDTTLRGLGVLALDPGTSADVRDGARKLLESVRARAASGAG